MDAKAVLDAWFAFGEDAEVTDAGDAGWRSANELGDFADRAGGEEDGTGARWTRAGSGRRNCRPDQPALTSSPSIGSSRRESSADRRAPPRKAPPTRPPAPAATPVMTWLFWFSAWTWALTAGSCARRRSGRLGRTPASLH